jgi:hypothetical protein
MKRKNRPDITMALKKIDSAPNNMFGNIEVDVSTLPCMNKPQKEKITANFDKELLKTIRKIASANNIPYTELMNDVLSKVFLGKIYR